MEIVKITIDVNKNAEQKSTGIRHKVNRKSCKDGKKEPTAFNVIIFYFTSNGGFKGYIFR